MKIKEHDCVVLKSDLPGEQLEAGDVGTVAHVHQGGAAYEVEFTTLDGRTLTVVTVESQQLRPVSRRDVAHVRELSPFKLPRRCNHVGILSAQKGRDRR
jgi:hypothetical protein